MTIRPLSALTALEFEEAVKRWSKIQDQAMADAMAMPGPGWAPVLDRLLDEAMMLIKEKRRRRLN